MNGLVIRNTGSWYTVQTDDGQLLDCKVKGNFRLKGIRSTNPVAVGDRVSVIPQADQAGGHGDGAEVNRAGLITDIVERRNYVIRKASNLSKQSHIIAANVDVALLVVTLAHPETSTTFIDRFLASTEAYRVPVTLVFNKVDLLDAEELRLLDAVTALYESLHYPCLRLSAQTGEGMDTLLQHIAGKTCLLSGNSGVGKSTLLNRLVPEAHARTAELSSAHDAGQHTTTFSQLYWVAGGGALIDTPGIKGFGTFDMERSEVGHYFREIFQTGRDCRYGDCTHTHEPGCAVLQALHEQRIALSRYQSYLSILEDKDADKYRQGY